MLQDSALFFCLANLDEVTKDSAWWTWPEELRFRQPQAVSDATSKFKQDIDRFVTIQFLFDKYWKAVKVRSVAQPKLEGLPLVSYCLQCKCIDASRRNERN